MRHALVIAAIVLFGAPAMAGIQALIDQKAGGPQGNPNPVYYDLAKSQYGSASMPHEANIAACNSSNGTIGSSACRSSSASAHGR